MEDDEELTEYQKAKRQWELEYAAQQAQYPPHEYTEEEIAEAMRMYGPLYAFRPSLYSSLANLN